MLRAATAEFFLSRKSYLMSNNEKTGKNVGNQFFYIFSVKI